MLLIQQIVDYIMLIRDRNIRLPQVLEIAGVGRSKLYQLIDEGKFPEARKLGRVSLWSEAEVLAWQNRLMGREREIAD